MHKLINLKSVWISFGLYCQVPGYSVWTGDFQNWCWGQETVLISAWVLPIWKSGNESFLGQKWKWAWFSHSDPCWHCRLHRPIILFGLDTGLCQESLKPSVAGHGGRSRPHRHVGKISDSSLHITERTQASGCSPLISCAVNSYGLILKGGVEKKGINDAYPI